MTETMKSYTGPKEKIPLPFPIDERFEKAQDLTEVITRPPHIESLEDWDNQVFPTGAKKGMTFHQAYQEDEKYASYMKHNKHLRSLWAVSYQNYVRARDQLKPRASVEAQMPMTTRGTSSTSSSVKRSLETETSAMQVEVERQKIVELQTQMAILQRDLDSARATVWNGTDQ